ncbi:MAG: hypothetical protein AAFR57_16770 [Pseudomonadota bacterium]
MASKIRPRSACLTLLVSVAMALPAGAQDAPAALRDLSHEEVGQQQLRSAVASRTLTWLTGTASNNDYISVGRLANFFGFVALRVSSRQSLTRAHVARDTLSVLEPSQIEVLTTLLEEQVPAHRATQDARIQMNRSLERLAAGEIVDEDAFMSLGRSYGAAEAELGRVIAQSFGTIASSLTAEQRADLALIRAGHAAGEPVAIPRPDSRAALSDVDRKELVNLAARFLSWTTGSPEFNDFEVVGKPSQHFGFVSLRLASGHGVRRGAVAQEVLAILTPDQHRMLDVAVEENLEAFNGFLDARGHLMRALEVALTGEEIDRAAVQRFGTEIGKIEAQMTWAQATAMLTVRDALAEAQLDKLLALRAKYTVAPADESAQASVDLGRQLFAQCALCHASSRDNAVAPSLAGILDGQIASDDGFDHYSPALRTFAEAERIWNSALLDSFLRSPRALVPGTTMGFDGFDNARDRDAILAYLATLE